ncbi:MAG TPA: GNVR domain-containing protein, partial [Longimicrobium sp.]
IAEKEVEIVALRRTATADNPRLRAASSELGALRQQLERLSSGGGSGRILVPFQQSPALRVGAARVMREYTRNEQIYVALNTALAQAQIDLNGSLPVVTVVDTAAVPATPSGPGLPVTVLVAGVIGLLSGACLAIARELVHHARRDPEHDPFLAMWRGIRAERTPHVASRG